jgi:hypothetical protein
MDYLVARQPVGANGFSGFNRLDRLAPVDRLTPGQYGLFSSTPASWGQRVFWFQSVGPIGASGPIDARPVSII